MSKIKIILIHLLIFTSISSFANEVEKWTSLMLQAIRINKTNPPIASRNLAILQVGMFDTVNSITNKYRPYSMQIEENKDLLQEVGVAQSARDLLVKLYPSSTPYWNEQLEKTLSSFPDNINKFNSIDLGSRIANNVWDLRKNDLKSNLFDKVLSNLDFELGVWIPTAPAYAPALLPEWGKTKTFGLLRGDQFRQDGPPKMYSSEYAQNYLEVKELGAKNNSKRTAKQTQLAFFWADGAGTVSPPGHWNRIALEIIKNKKMDIVESSRLLTLLNIALADAGIAAWDMKYTYNCWRPITAIAEAGRDDNDETQPDSSWEPLLSTPPFPEYVSGHSTFSAAASTILELYFGTDKFSFTTESEGLPGVILSYSRFSEAADEAGKSRIYGGIHYEFANRDGKNAGRKIAEFVFNNLLLKK